MKYFRLLIFTLFLSITLGQKLQEGDSCPTIDGLTGNCTKENDCDEEFREGTCDEKNNLYCCVPSSISSTPTSFTCPNIALNVSKNGKNTSWDACIDLIESVCPCVPSTVSSERIREDLCAHTAVDLIVGGTRAKKDEFPHMALLGFGERNNIKWKCGGTLISDKWVMTAAHCINPPVLGLVKYVRLGDGPRSDNITEDLLFDIAYSICHPKYKTGSFYYDIALIKLNRSVTFSKSIRPACLHNGNPVDDIKAIATGWGSTEEFGAGQSDYLLKVVLEKFSYEECHAAYGTFRYLKDGIDNDTQCCYGDHTGDKDTCYGDSGGPLQIYNQDVYCTYIIIGVTSFGKGCGAENTPSVFTRVSAFLPWIESEVWPEKNVNR